MLFNPVASYTGNDARVILSEKSANVLEEMVQKKASAGHSSHWYTNIRPVLIHVADAIRKYDTVIVRTQTLNLHPEWQSAIDEFEESHKVLGNAFTALFPRRRGDDYMTPKVACVIFDVPRWIKKFNWSLIVVSEQAFEAVHYEYMELEKLYKIPLCGAELIAGKRRWTSDPSWGTKNDQKDSDPESSPAKKRGSRKPKKRAASKKKKKPTKAAKKPPAKAKKTRKATTTLTARYARAKELQRLSVAAFNAQNVATNGTKCIERMKELINFKKKAAGGVPPWRA